jgi:hypothetical protein
MYVHGEPWWNDINSRKLMILPSELSGNSTSSHLVVKQEDSKGNYEFSPIISSAYRISLVRRMLDNIFNEADSNDML